MKIMTQNGREIYASDDLYDRLIKAAARADINPATGKPGPDEIMLALGEYGDIWPISITNQDAKITTGNVVCFPLKTRTQ